MTDSNPSVYKCGRGTVLLAPNPGAGGAFIIPAGGTLTIQGDEWRVPRPLKIARLHLFVAADEGFAVTVNSLTFGNHQVMYGPLPSIVFQGFVEIVDAVGVSAVDPSRQNPWIGTEVDQNTQIKLIVQNFSAAPIQFLPYFTCDVLTGKHSPDWGP